MAHDNKILAVIPARGGSKGVHRKNIKQLLGKPLIAWTIEAAKKSIYLDKTIVTTEDDEIAQICTKYGIEVLKRSQDLATDTARTVDVVINSLNQLADKGYKANTILLLQCTSPTRLTRHIDEAILSFINNEKADSLISVSEVTHTPWWNKKINNDGFLEDFLSYDKINLTKRQDFPPIYIINGSIYIIKTNVLLEKKSFETNSTIAYVMERKYSIDIDDNMDFAIAETIMAKEKFNE